MKRKHRWRERGAQLEVTRQGHALHLGSGADCKEADVCSQTGPQRHDPEPGQFPPSALHATQKSASLGPAVFSHLTCPFLLTSIIDATLLLATALIRCNRTEVRALEMCFYHIHICSLTNSACPLFFFVCLKPPLTH